MLQQIARRVIDDRLTIGRNQSRADPTIKPGAKRSILAMMFTMGAVAAAGSLAPAASAEQNSTGNTVYVAKLAPLNTSVTGSEASGEAKFTIANNQLTIVVDATGLPPGIAHSTFMVLPMVKRTRHAPQPQPTAIMTESST